MLHHGRQRHRKRLRKFADGQLRTRGQACKERTPRWVGQRGECTVQCVFLKLNHEVNYREGWRDVKALFEIFLEIVPAVAAASNEGSSASIATRQTLRPPCKTRASFSDERRNGIHAVRWPFMNPAHMSLPILPSSHMLTQPVNLALQGIEPA